MASLVIPTAAAYANTLRWTALFIAPWCIVASLETLAVRRSFWPGRALGVDLAALSIGKIRPRILVSPLCAPRGLLLVPAVRLVAGMMLPFVAADLRAVTLILLVIIGSTAILSIVLRGSDGADKMALVACVAALLLATGRLLDDRWLCLAGIAWGAGQATIAYVTSGATKLARPFWRDGTAFAAAMTSYQSGHALTAAVVRRRSAAITLAWAVMLLEIAFPIALFARPAVCFVILAALAAFHVATAVFMGLNTYPWAFLAVYPCVVMANAILTAAMRAAG